MAKAMRISPRYSVDDWKALTFTSEGDWKKAVEIFEDRMRGRFFEPIDAIKTAPFSGFAVLALDSLLIESLQQFRTGKAKTPSRQSGQYFIDFLTGTSFNQYFDAKTAYMFYEQIRCGILHQAEVKESSLVRTDSKLPLVDLAADGKGLVINRRKFHQEMEKVFKKYMADLLDPANGQLRTHFRAKMNHICRLP